MIKMKRNSQRKGLIPRRTYIRGSFDRFTTKIEKKNSIARAVVSRTRKIVMIKAINSIIFALASIPWTIESTGI
jgi:hypothetical protein